MTLWSSLRLALLVAAFLPLSLCAVPAAAQAAEPPAPPPRVETLEQVLALVDWDAARRGPLLVINPKGTGFPFPKQAGPFTTPTVPPLPPEAYAALQLAAPLFARQLIRVGTLTVIAPTEMTLLTARPGYGDPLADLSRDAKLSLLLATLTGAQWRRLGGTDGLGAGDLATAEQRALFTSLLPDPFVLRRTTVGKAGAVDRNEGEERFALSAIQRSGVRLRLSRSLAWSFVQEETSYATITQTPDPRPEGTPVYVLASDADLYGEAPRPEVFGLRVLTDAPNRLKPGHLRFDAPAFDVPVAFDSADTMGELVRRVGQRCGLDLHADARLAALPIWTRGGASARSGDVLKALCLAVTGTFRRVGEDGDPRPAFVLTDDLVGFGTRRARVSEWSRELGARKNKIFRDARARIMSQQPAPYLAYDADDVVAPGPQVTKRLEEWRGSANPSNSLNVPITELPAAAQRTIAEQLARIQETMEQFARLRPDLGAYPPVRSDVVRISEQVRMTFMVPGTGEVVAGFMMPDELDLLGTPPATPLPNPSPPAPSGPLRLPTTSGPATTFALRVGASVPLPDVVAVAEAARGRGLNQIWLGVDPDQPDAAARLAGAVRAGQQNGMGVVGVVPLLSVPAAQSDNDAVGRRDRNLFGETSAAFLERSERSAWVAQQPWLRDGLEGPRFDWLRVDVAVALAERQRRVGEIASTPGLAGLTLVDTAAPGYTAPENGDRAWGDENNDLGYTPTLRRDFLRAAGVDPVDLGPAFVNVNGRELSLPFFSHDAPVAAIVGKKAVTVRQQWNNFRRTANVERMKNLHAALRAAAPALPLLVGDRSDSSELGAYVPSWYGSWDRAGVLPSRTHYGIEGPGKRFIDQARAASRRVLWNARPFVLPGQLAPADPVAAFAAWAVPRAGGEQLRTWDGIVFDVSGWDAERVLRFVRLLEPVAEKPRRP